MARNLDDARMDKRHFSVGSLHDEGEEKLYWSRNTPQERLEALELLRQIVYGYDPDVDRMLKILSVVQLRRDKAGPGPLAEPE